MDKDFEKVGSSETLTVYERDLRSNTRYTKNSAKVIITHNGNISEPEALSLEIMTFNSELVRMTDLFVKNRSNLEEITNKICEDKNVDQITNILGDIKDNPAISKIFEQVTIKRNTNKMGNLRKKIAHDIDETLGTHLEEKKIAKPIKKIEKAISDKLFGKVKE